MKNDYWGFLNVPMKGPTSKRNIVMAHSSIAYSIFFIQTHVPKQGCTCNFEQLLPTGFAVSQ